MAPFLPVIKQALTSGPQLTSALADQCGVEERVKPAEVFKPEVASLKWARDFELACSRCSIATRFQVRLGGALPGGTGPSFSQKPSATSNSYSRPARTTTPVRCSNVRYRAPLQSGAFLERGLVKPPLFVQGGGGFGLFSASWAASAHKEEVMHRPHCRRCRPARIPLVGGRRAQTS